MMRLQALLPLVSMMVAVLAPPTALGADAQPTPPATHITRVAAVNGPLSADAKCTGAPPTVLIGPGSFEIAVPTTDLAEADKYAAASPGDDRRVFINGIDVTSSIDPLLGPKSNDATCAFLRYRLKPGVDSQKLWSAVYRQVGLTGETKAAFQLGWKSTGPNSITEKDAGDTRIAVSSQTLVAAATLSLLALVGFFLWLYQRSDVFRDPPPDWLALARMQEKRYLTAQDDAARAAALSALFSPPDAYAAANVPNYVAAAKAIRGGSSPPADVGAAGIAVGFLIDRRQSGLKLPKPSLSLARLQVAVWFLFAIAATVFLWIVTWELPALQGSMLGILGIATGTSGASMMVSNNLGLESKMPSRGLLVDILTGFDDRQHVHRYQSFVVNALLLVAGNISVVQNLQLPIFDTNWLAFLGLSGIASAAGKQLVEGK